MNELNDVFETLKRQESALKQKGVLHASIFGSTARKTQTQESDIDIMIDLDESKLLSVFDYAKIKDDLSELLGVRADIVTRNGLKPSIRERILKEEVRVF